MNRTKVKLAFIGNNSVRKTTYKKKKRKNGMVKKTSELVTLCGVEACMIIYNPYDAEPEIWPSSIGVQSTIARFMQTPEMDQCKKMTNQMSFTRERIQKVSEQNMSAKDLYDLKWLIEHNLRDGQEEAEEDHNNGEGIMEMMNISTLQRQQNFMELMNCVGNDERVPFGDANLYHDWPSSFYF
ncbi:hypothetical protein K1719_043476 [Acacia pycnantha]|nr:hypothetical protein K1719_043476 [Acacia pycnantha]